MAVGVWAGVVAAAWALVVVAVERTRLLGLAASSCAECSTAALNYSAVLLL